MQPAGGLAMAGKGENEPEAAYPFAERLKFYNVPGVSVAVFEKGKPTRCTAYGYADVSKGEPVTPDTRFQAASISKAVTAFAALKLAAQGQLDLDRDVNEYLTGWKVPTTAFTQQEKVTVRRLLNHTAGVAGGGFQGYKKTAPVPTTADILNGRGSSPPIVVEAVPGSRYAYSGAGYVVLQQVLEDVMRQPFAALMQQVVLTPLHMGQSTFDQLPEKNVSLAYSNGQVCEGGWLIYPELAPAGLWTTPGDLAKFSLAVQHAAAAGPDAFLPPDLAQAMLTPRRGLYGLGIVVRGEGEARSFYHPGSNPGGYQSLMINYPAKGVGIIIMTNSSQGASLRDELFLSLTRHYGLRASRRSVSTPLR